MSLLQKKLGYEHQKVGDLHDAPFQDNTFDFLYAGQIIEHTWKPGKMISECYRILKKGGYLIIDTPNHYSFASLSRFVFKGTDWMGDNRTLTYHESKDAFGLLKENEQTLLQPQHKVLFTPAVLKQLLEMHGFTIEHYGITHKSSSIFGKIAQKLFPHLGNHLCFVARKATVEEAFSDIEK